MINICCNSEINPPNQPPNLKSTPQPPNWGAIQTLGCCIPLCSLLTAFEILPVLTVGRLVVKIFFTTKSHKGLHEGITNFKGGRGGSLFISPTTGLDSVVVCPRRAAPDVRVFKAYGLSVLTFLTLCIWQKQVLA